VREEGGGREAGKEGRVEWWEERAGGGKRIGVGEGREERGEGRGKRREERGERREGEGRKGEGRRRKGEEKGRERERERERESLPAKIMDSSTTLLA
jgi:hypothetical protein